MKQLFLMGVVLSAFAIQPAIANEKAAPLLMYKGKPIDPLCFDLMMFERQGLDTKEISVDLDTCHIQNPKDHLTKDGPLITEPDGTLGYKFKTDRNDGYTEYRYLGKVGAYDYVLVNSSSGGTADFNYISKYKISGSELKKIKDSSLYSGDRCNGGISDVRVEEGHLFYKRQMTPSNFAYMASERNNIPYKPDVDVFLSTPADCTAVADYKDGNIVGIDLSEGSAPASTMGCFGKARIDFMSKYGSYIQATEISEFLTAITETCSSKKLP